MEETEIRHSPTPWRFQEGQYQDVNGDPVYVHLSGFNRDFVLAAVNSYDDRVKKNAGKKRMKKPNWEKLDELALTLLRARRLYGWMREDGAERPAATFLVPEDARAADYPRQRGGITIHLRRVPAAEPHLRAAI